MQTGASLRGIPVGVDIRKTVVWPLNPDTPPSHRGVEFRSNLVVVYRHKLLFMHLTSLEDALTYLRPRLLRVAYRDY